MLEAVMLVLLFLFASLFAASGGLFDIFKSKVCYDLIGCFRTKAPFTNSWRELPDSPDEIGVTLTLYTRSNPHQGQALDYKDPKSVVGTHFDFSADTKLIIHGYTDDGTEAWNVNLIKTFLEAGPFNVIKVAWGPGARKIYPKAVANTRVVGAVTAYFLTSLNNQYNVSLARVHILGHSLGAHIAGYAGAGAGGIGRISGMDPAGPLYESTDPAVRIDPTDADYVDCIHTNGLPLEDFGFGTMSAWCDADFYPNGGGHQPGCPKPVPGALSDVFALNVDDVTTEIACSHIRSHEFYMYSIGTCAFPATPCDSYKDFRAGKCTCSTAGCPSMGYHAADSKPRGTFYLDTTSSAPFC